MNGCFADLSNVNSVALKTNQWNPLFTYITTFQNKTYGVGLRYDRIDSYVLLFNKMLASKYDLGNFYDFVDKNQWTFNMFMQKSLQFKIDAPKINVCEGLYPQDILNMVYADYTSSFEFSQQQHKWFFDTTEPNLLNTLYYFCRNYIRSGLYNTKYDSSDFQSDGSFKACAADSDYSKNLFINGKSLF